MSYGKNPRKVIAIGVIIAFVFQMNLFLYSQGKDELLKQFDRAREAYNTGLYANTRNRVERIIAILNEKDMDRKQIMGACFLMLGAIYEKEEKNRLAEENYRKAIKVYGVDMVTGVDFSLLPVYKRVKEIVGIENRFESAMSDYSKGTEEKYTAAAETLKALEKVLDVNIPEEKIFLGKVFLLLAGVYERLYWRETAAPTAKKRAKTLKKSAKVYYRKARKILAPKAADTVTGDDRVILKPKQSNPITGIDLTDLKYYRKHYLGKKKFPWLLVIGGVIVVGLVVYFLFLKPKKKYQVTVDMGEGVEGTPAGGTYDYKKGSTVTYSFEKKAGYADLSVKLDLVEMPASGTFKVTRNHILTAVAEENDVNFITDAENDRLNINEGETGTLNVKLSAQPAADVNAEIQRVFGDSSIHVAAGNNLTFTLVNWDIYQQVTLRADNDDDDKNGETTILIKEKDGSTNPPSKHIYATEIDKDISNLYFVTNTDDISIEEETTGTFKVRLSAIPPSDVAVEIAFTPLSNNDPSITIQSAPNLTFTPSNWNQPQTVTVYAAEDSDSENGKSQISITALNVTGIPVKIIDVQEVDKDKNNFITNTNQVPVSEGASGNFQVRLSAAPTGAVDVDVQWLRGDDDIFVASGDKLVFSPENWNTFQQVTLEAREDDDAENSEAVILIRADGYEDKEITAEEVDNDILTFVTDTGEITVTEEGTAQLLVKLSAAPLSDTDVSVGWISGDKDIYVSDGANLLFTPSDWNTYKTVTLSADKDEDNENGQALIRIDATGIESREITVREEDGGAGDPPEISIYEPDNDGTVSDDVDIKAVASDDFGIQKVEFYIDNVLEETVTQAPYWYSPWSTKTVAAGTHQIKAIAYDTENQTSNDQISVTVVDNPPTASLSLSPDLATVSGLLSIFVEATDYKGISQITLYMNDTILKEWSGSDDPRLELDTTEYANGTYIFKAVAYDTANQESQPSSKTVTISN